MTDKTTKNTLWGPISMPISDRTADEWAPVDRNQIMRSHRKYWGRISPERILETYLEFGMRVPKEKILETVRKYN